MDAIQSHHGSRIKSTVQRDLWCATQVGRAGLCQSHPHWFSKQSTTGAREMVTDEIRHMEEENGRMQNQSR